MTAPARIALAKMNGLGNEIVVADLRASAKVLTTREVEAIARLPRLSFDQLMALHPPRTAGTDAFVRIYNSDGSEVGACGNGIRLRLELAGHVGRDLCGVADKGRLQIDAALVGQHQDRPQAVGQFVGQLRLAVVDVADAGVRLDQLCQVADITHEAQGEFLRGPGPAVLSCLQLLIERIEL